MLRTIYQTVFVIIAKSSMLQVFIEYLKCAHQNQVDQSGNIRSRRAAAHQTSVLCARGANFRLGANARFQPCAGLQRAERSDTGPRRTSPLDRDRSGPEGSALKQDSIGGYGLSTTQHSAPEKRKPTFAEVGFPGFS